MLAKSENPQSERANSAWAAVCQSLNAMSHDYEFVVQALRNYLQHMKDLQPQQTDAPKMRIRKASSKNDIGDVAPLSQHQNDVSFEQLPQHSDSSFEESARHGNCWGPRPNDCNQGNGALFLAGQNDCNQGNGALSLARKTTRDDTLLQLFVFQTMISFILFCFCYVNYGNYVRLCTQTSFIESFQ